MNRRLPRFALLVVLILSIIGIGAFIGSGISPNLVRAEGPSCEKYRSEPSGPPADGNFEEISRDNTPEQFQEFSKRCKQGEFDNII